jgi:peptidoglycan-associated lipoprotein
MLSSTQIQWALSAILVTGLACSHAKPADRPANTMASSLKAPPAHKQLSANPADQQDGKSTNNGSIYFSLDSSELDPKSKALLQSVAKEAKNGHEIRIEGNCDERGTTEYNLALGDRRARVAAEYVEHLGVPQDKVVPVTYGSERPKAAGHDEEAWSQNRRDDVVIR